MSNIGSDDLALAYGYRMLLKLIKGTPGLVFFTIVLAVSLTVISLSSVSAADRIKLGYAYNICRITTRSPGPADPIGDAFLRTLSRICPGGSKETTPQIVSVTPTLVQTIYTSRWLPPSPDPAGITYVPATRHLLISDSEVDEMHELFTGRNIFEISLDGVLLRTHSTMSFSSESTGITLDPSDGHIFVSDDDNKKIYEIAAGSDGEYWTADDMVRPIDITEFGVRDAEDVAYGDGRLFIADGDNQAVWIISAGSNGRFDGPPPNGDDTAVHFETPILGVQDPEGIAYDPTTGNIWLCSKKSPIVEVTTTGTLVRSFDISFVDPHDPDAIILAPGSNNPFEIHLWVADRMVDNNHDPNENDGRIYEFDIGKDPAVTPSTESHPVPIQRLPFVFASVISTVAAAMRPGIPESDGQAETHRKVVNNERLSHLPKARVGLFYSRSVRHRAHG